MEQRCTTRQAEGQGMLYVVIPCFNEEASVLARTLEELRKVLFPCRLIVVDDGSAVPVQVREDGVVVLRHAVNLGQGAALQTGMAYACRQKNMSLVAHFDADGQHRPEDLLAFRRLLEEGSWDVILGSRFLIPEDGAAVPLGRRYLIFCGKIVNWLFTRLWLTDAHNGLRCLNRRAAEAIELRENRMAHASEILREIRLRNLRYCEAPCHVTYSEYSRRKGQRAANGVNILLDLLLGRCFR